MTKTTTFEQAARKVHAEQAPGWKPRHAGQWASTLCEYVFPRIGAESVANLTPRHFAEVLRPIWLTKPETALRIKQRCHMVMRWCWAHALITGNPVDVVEHLLPQRVARVQHQPAMPWRGVPVFVREVLHAGEPTTTKALLEFVILTAARSGEARAAMWSEIDFDTAVWTIPVVRMKAKAAHRVPLSQGEVHVLLDQQLARRA